MVWNRLLLIFQSSLRLNSNEESSIQIKDCLFEAGDSASSSSLYYVREGKKQFPINVVDCTFTGKLSKGVYHIDGDSISRKNDKLMIKVEKCKFESDKKLALNSKLNVL